MKKHLLSACFLFFLAISAFSQSDSTETVFISTEFKWKIVIPNGYRPMGEEEWGKMQKRGLDALEKANDVQIDNQTVTLFVYRKDQVDYLEANWQPMDDDMIEDYDETRTVIGDAIFKAMQQQIPVAKIDSSYSKEKIDGLDFYVFTLKVPLPGDRMMRMILYSRLFGNKEFSFNCIAVRDERLKEILDAFRNSSFHQ